MGKKLSVLGTITAAADTDALLAETGNGGKRILRPHILNIAVEGNAGAHNAIYRGKYLGNTVSAEAYAAINAGTFDPADTAGLFIGDYWTIDGVSYRIAAFDYWLHCGDTECTKHHVVLVPDAVLYSASMNSSNVTTGAYVGSAMYTSGLSGAKSTINSAFGSGHVLNHREYLTNAVSSGYASAGAWYDSTVDLMNENMVYGSAHFRPQNYLGATIPHTHTIDKSQLPLFQHDHSRITIIRTWWWLRDVVFSTSFAATDGSGYSGTNDASISSGVRPAFAICAA